MFGDREFVKLSMSHRYLYIGLIYLAVETQNKVYNDRTWIAQRLYIKCTDVHLSPLYRAGFLECSNSRRASSEAEAETEAETEAEAERSRASRARDAVDAPASPPHATTRKSQRSATELPPDWAVNARHQSIAAGSGLLIQLEAAKFRDRALATGAKYRDWDAAFRNWLRNAHEFHRRRRSG
jgi:hypothetical protein